MRETQPWTLDNRESVHRRLESANSDSIVFVGGEPTINETLAAWVAKATRAGASSVHVQTNGRLLGRGDLAMELASVGLDSADISLHGAKAVSHDYHTGVPGSFAETCAGISAAGAAGIRAGVTTVITRSNYRELTELVGLASTLGAIVLHMSFPRSVGKARDQHERLMAPFGMVLPHLKRAAVAARIANVPMVVSGVPLCILGASAAAALEVQAAYKFQGHYAEPCDGCSLRDFCPGIDPLYYARFGDSELSTQTRAADELVSQAEYFAEAARYFSGVGTVEVTKNG